jgi:predicted DNA binding CopG/RHH family protein
MKDATKQIEWLEAMRELNKTTKVEKPKLITMKVDPSLLKAFKLKCELEKRPYTTRIKELMHEYLENNK